MKKFSILHFALLALMASGSSFGAGEGLTTAPRMPVVSANDLTKYQKESSEMVKSDSLQANMKEGRDQTLDVIRKFSPQHTGMARPDLTLNMPKVSPEAMQQRGTNDYEKLAKQFYAGVEQQQVPDDLVVFVSLSMPMESLRALADQSARYGAVMVLRGLKDNSLKATLKAMKEVVGNNSKVNIQINPVVFNKLDVQLVPTFAVIKGRDVGNGESKACAPASAYMSVAGNVPLDYALEKLAADSPREFAEIADAHIKMGRVQ